MINIFQKTLLSVQPRCNFYYFIFVSSSRHDGDPILMEIKTRTIKLNIGDYACIMRVYKMYQSNEQSQSQQCCRYH